MIARKDDRFSFGKYKGIKILNVCVDDWSYIDWCLDNVKGFSLTEQEMEIFRESRDRTEERRAEREERRYNTDPWESFVWEGVVSPWGSDFM